ncbi:hypothetical protein KI387_023547, partial [Taxus chinensis]
EAREPISQLDDKIDKESEDEGDDSEMKGKVVASTMVDLASVPASTEPIEPDDGFGLEVMTSSSSGVEKVGRRSVSTKTGGILVEKVGLVNHWVDDKVDWDSERDSIQNLKDGQLIYVVTARLDSGFNVVSNVVDVLLEYMGGPLWLGLATLHADSVGAVGGISQLLLVESHNEFMVNLWMSLASESLGAT